MPVNESLTAIADALARAWQLFGDKKYASLNERAVGFMLTETHL